MTLTFHVSLAVALLTAEVFYIRAARYWGLVDKPNGRSLHADATTVRGGGVIFWLAAFSVFIHSGFPQPWFFIGLTLVATISFLDDVRHVSKRYRLIIQSIGCSLALVQVNILANQWVLLMVLLMTGVSLLNAYNFMDGINGITAFYSLVTVGTLWYWFLNLPIPSSENILVAETAQLFPAVFIALLVFAFFNARKQAVCFAGDVGSISMGFFIGYELLCLIYSTHSFLPLMLLAVYGLDTGLTIGHRAWLQQNIFQPHHQHLFQVLVREAKWSHLQVASLFAALQLVINCLVIVVVNWPVGYQWLMAGTILGSMTVIYVRVKWPLINPKKAEPFRPGRDDMTQPF